MEQEIKIKTGTTTVGLTCKDCVILASDSKTTLGSLVFAKHTDKVIQIDDRMAVTTAGGSGDIQAVIRMLKAEIKLYKLMRNTDITVNAVANLMSNILQGSRYYPYIAFLILGGVDKNGVHLISTDVVGGLEEKEKYVSTGSGSPYAYGVLENEFKENMDRQAGIRIAARSIRAGMERDTASGGKEIHIAVIDQSGLKFVSQADVHAAMK